MTKYLGLLPMMVYMIALTRSIEMIFQESMRKVLSDSLICTADMYSGVSFRKMIFKKFSL
jgi:hypothetical protein